MSTDAATPPKCHHRIGPEQAALSDRIWREYGFNLPCAWPYCRAGFNGHDLVIEKMSHVYFTARPTCQRALFRRVNVRYTEYEPIRLYTSPARIFPSWPAVEWEVSL